MQIADRPKCPLCMAVNSCQADKASCWCMDEQVDSLALQQMLKAQGVAEDNPACLCQSCLKHVASLAKPASRD